MKALTRPLGAALAAISIACSVTACGGESQSLAEACEAVSSHITEANEQMVTAIGEVNAGTKNPKDVFGPISTTLEQVANDVQNSELKEPVTALANAFSEFAHLYDDFDYEAVKNGDKDATEAYKKISQDSLDKLDALAASGTDVENICNEN